MFASLAGFTYNAIFTQTDVSEGVLMMKKESYTQYRASWFRAQTVILSVNHVTDTEFTGHNELDEVLDFLVNFFNYALIPGTTARTHLVDFFASLPVWVALMELEAVRTGAGGLARWTLGKSRYVDHSWTASLTLSSVWGTWYQLKTGAFVAPFYFAYLLTRPPTSDSISYSGAQAVLLSILLGLFPTIVAMFARGTGWDVLAFQIFPLPIWIIRNGYLYVKADSISDPTPRISNDRDGYRLTQLTYLLLASIASYIHITTIIIPALGQPLPLNYLQKLYIPAPLFTAPSPDITTPYSAAVRVFQWDYIMIFFSSFVAGVWEFSLLEKLLAAAWFLVVTVMLGAGPAVAGVWMWREKKLMDERRLEAEARTR